MQFQHEDGHNFNFLFYFILFFIDWLILFPKRLRCYVVTVLRWGGTLSRGQCRWFSVQLTYCTMLSSVKMKSHIE